MAHFARIESGIVREVIVVKNCAIGGCIGLDHPDYMTEPTAHADCGTLDFPDTEPIGQAFIASIGLSGEYRQASYSGSFRSAYPGQGWRYDADADEFIPPPPPDAEA